MGGNKFFANDIERVNRPELWTRATLTITTLLLGILGLSGCNALAAAANPDPPQLMTDHSDFIWGFTNIGTTCAITNDPPNGSGTLKVSNGGGGNLQISNITVSNITDFPATTSCPIPGNLAGGDSCQIHAQFSPKSSGFRNGKITIVTNATTVDIPLSGCANDVNFNCGLLGGQTACGH
jgi:hypothetical protein